MNDSAKYDSLEAGQEALSFGPDPTCPLSLHELEKGFTDPGGSRVILIEGVSLQLNQGESVSIQGDSGCGKTTLLNLMAGLEYPDSGQVKWQGIPYGPPLARVRGRHVGMIFQHYSLVSELTVLENVLLAWRIARGGVTPKAQERAQNLLRYLGLDHRNNSLPQPLSGGERQRVAIARALMSGPSLILADEPTGNLDPSSAQGVMECLLEACQVYQSALVLVTHHPGFASLTQKSYRLSEKRLHSA